MFHIRLIWFLSAYCPCCQYGDEYYQIDYVEDDLFLPDDHITVYDPFTPPGSHHPDEIRMSSETGVTFLLPDEDDEDAAYIELDMIDATNGASFVKVGTMLSRG